MKRISIHLGKWKRALNLPFPVFAMGCKPWAYVPPSRLTHPTVDFSLVLAGDPVWRQGACDGVEYRVRIPYLKVNVPGKIYDAATDGMAEEVYFAYDRALLPAFRRAFPMMDAPPCRAIVITPLMEILLQQVEQLAQESHLPGVADRLDLCAMQLIAEAFAGTSGATDSPELVVRKIASWLEVHFMEPDCAQWRDLPRRFGISYRSFLRHWHKLYNRTPQQFILDLRVQAGRRLLETTNLSIKKITLQIGMDDPYYFSRIFKSHTGASPGAWRKKYEMAQTSR